jgi:hypothetical protein
VKDLRKKGVAYALCDVFAGACLVLSAPFEALAGTPASTPSFYPINLIDLPLPEGMQPLWPTFSADGRDILFQNGSDRQVWIIGADGSSLKCVTCGLPDRPPTNGGGFIHAFPDGKRLLITDGVAPAVDLPTGVNARVLECEVSVRDCQSPKVLPVDMSADRGGPTILQRRTFHMSPDGSLIGWMEVRTDGTPMIVAQLERASDKYVAADPQVVNPIGPRSPDDDSATRWENLSQLYELKSFTPDGRAILAVGTPNNNVDVLRIELSTGAVTRLTSGLDWDEDSSLSPDQSLFVLNSWRGQHRLDALAWIPEIRGFIGLMVGAAIAPYYVSTWEGFQCDLTPWLLSAQGDEGGRLLGQPLRTFEDDKLTAGNNLQGQRVWSPDSTLVLLQERLRVRDRAAPNRVAIARIDRAPSTPVTSVRSAVGSWAPPAKDFKGPHAMDRIATVRGARGGSAVITYSGNLGGGNAATKVVFDKFTDDGITFVTGTMSGAAGGTGEGEHRGWLLLADITLSGRHTGSMEMNLRIDNAKQPLPEMTGTLRAVRDGKVAPPLPTMGPCYATQPKASPLNLDLQRYKGRVRANVTANVYGDVRPVRNASVTVGSVVVRTDAIGRAWLPYGSIKGRDVTARAGDTFVAVTRRLSPSQETTGNEDR